MPHPQKRLQRLRSLCQAGMIAALYITLTLLSSAFGLSGGVVQLRISEALCVLPVLLPAAIPGLTVGCFFANLITGCLWQDILFGTLATLLGAVGAYLLRNAPLWTVPIPTVILNVLLIPPVLAYAYRMEIALPLLMLSVGLGELLSAYLLGLVLLVTLKRYGADRLF